MERKYSDNIRLNKLIENAVDSIQEGKPAEGLTAMIKNAPTGILKASLNHEEKRYQPGNQLVTYNGIDEAGNPIQETWGGGVADVTEDSVILKNVTPISYGEKHALHGQKVKGSYDTDGKFHLNQEEGDSILFNEWMSNVKYVAGDPANPNDHGAYGITPTETWQEAFKLDRCYVLEVPKGITNEAVQDLFREGSGAAQVSAGDAVIIGLSKDKVNGVFGCEKAQLEKTYVDFEAHMKSLQK